MGGMKLDATARQAVPGEEVLAAGIFQAGGSLTARFASFGELSVRRREREERETSGINFKRYLLLVVTPGWLHVFDARSGLRGWKVAGQLASWSRSDIVGTIDTKSVTTRLHLEIPFENRRMELEAPKIRNNTSGEVARLVANGSAAAAPSQLPTPSLDASSFNASFPILEDRPDGQEAIGLLAVAGGVVRLISYFLPWIVVHGVTDVSFSGWTVMGGPFISVGYSIAIIVVGATYARGGEARPRLLQALGVGSIIAFGFQFSILLQRMSEFRSYLQDHGISTVAVHASMGFGVWVLLVGAGLVLVAGVRGRKLASLDSRREPYLPPRPDSAKTSL
jgi:hypothetical protein